jgi:hypothetical protein
MLDKARKEERRDEGRLLLRFGMTWPWPILKHYPSINRISLDILSETIADLRISGNWVEILTTNFTNAYLGCDTHRIYSVWL